MFRKQFKRNILLFCNLMRKFAKCSQNIFLLYISISNFLWNAKEGILQKVIEGYYFIEGVFFLPYTMKVSFSFKKVSNSFKTLTFLRILLCLLSQLWALSPCVQQLIPSLLIVSTFLVHCRFALIPEDFRTLQSHVDFVHT